LPQNPFRNVVERRLGYVRRPISIQVEFAKALGAERPALQDRVSKILFRAGSGKTGGGN
jgi:hypothetical protein